MSSFTSPIQFLRGALALITIPPLTALACLGAITDVRWLRKSKSKAQWFPRTWGRVLCRLANIQVRIEGGEQLDPAKPYIFIGNHCSMADIMSFSGYIIHDYRWIAKKELFAIPVFGAGMKAVDFISIDRSHGREAVQSLNDAAQRIAEGSSVILFPEGTRSPDGRLQPFKTGAVMLAIKAGVELVPVGFNGTHQALPKGKLLSRGGEVVLRIGNPLSIKNFKAKDKQEVAAILQQRVAVLLDECHLPLLELKKATDAAASISLPN
ncbi:1-acyl-sn-glycerol-3-phosphate acyltransferase [Desulfobulbus sp. F4]|nr:1-acyl-sn-glycerol-3-phosphate acyltransferase [Desulfobulbus sp. F3]MCW5200588.1 1-acyl-sn-glycerol-3-phosphate acyltransferase [Desulfobulbus sp. F4]